LDFLKEYPVLDNGIVRLVSFMGGDDAVVQAARVSFGKGITEQERDRKLLNYLMANHHETPFEHSVFKFHIKCPIFVARQWFRHRLASYNEISGRYTKMKEEFCLPETLRTQKARNYKFEKVDDELNDELKQKISDSYQYCYNVYKELLEKGVAKEHARIVLPLSLYTQFYWSINARALLNFLSLRLDEHAQYEIREYAKVIAKIMKDKMPWTFDAFDKFVVKGEKWQD
jgi:thymidylate synthase (FAD)